MMNELERMERAVYLALLLCMPFSLAHGQTDEDRMLPMRYARPTARLRRRLRKDWNNLAGQGREWAYCITGWTTDVTPAGDSLFAVDEVRPAAGFGDTHAVFDVSCVDKDGRDLPILHAHPSGDCSESRRDVATAIARPDVPFDMILCGPEQTRAYSGEMYRKTVLGVQLSRKP